MWWWVKDSWNALENKLVYHWTERTPTKAAFDLPLSLRNRSDPLPLWIKRLDWAGGGLANGCVHHHTPVSCAQTSSPVMSPLSPDKALWLLTLSVTFLLPIIKVGKRGKSGWKYFGPSKLEEHWGAALAKNGRLGFSQGSKKWNHVCKSSL